MSTDRLGTVLPATRERAMPGERSRLEAVAGDARDFDGGGVIDGDREVVEFVRFCYRRRSVAWPELYDEMCAVAARGAYRGMSYEQLEPLGIGFALSALPRLAALAARVVAEERGPHAVPGVAAGA